MLIDIVWFALAPAPGWIALGALVEHHFHLLERAAAWAERRHHSGRTA